MSVVKNLFFSREQLILDIPAWTIPDQGLSLLQGQSGSGKTTLLKILLGLESLSSFQWLFDKEDLNKKSISQRHIGVVFQDLCLFPHMSGLENIKFAAKARKLLVTGKTFDFLKNTFQLDAFLDKKVGLLSGGEAQRIALARALISKPKILFLDEAFNSLDEQLKQESQQLVKACGQKWKIPILMISHNKEDATMADHHFILKANKEGIKNIYTQ